MLLFSCAVSSAQAPASVPPNDLAHTVKLNNGVAMPLISLGTWQYSPAVAESTVRLGLSLGYNHIDAALDYKNQRSVGKALAEHDRASYFLTTKVPSRTSASSAFADTSKDLAADLEQLGLSYVDLMLVHFPPVGNTLHCAAMQEQWRALETFYRAKKARAIGVSNYCQSSLRCIARAANVTPAVNQIKYHIGMGPDPIGLRSYGDRLGIVTQAYSPLGDGTGELISGALVTGIGAKHNKSGAQVSLRWVVGHGVPVSTKSTSASHLTANLDLFGWEVSAQEKEALDAATSPKGHPSFMCDA